MAERAAADDHRGRYRWFLLTLYLFVTGASLLVMFSIGVMLPEMSGDLGLSSAQEGALGAASWMGAVLMYIPLTALLSRHPPVRVTTVVTIAGVCVIAVLAWAPTFELQMAARLLLVVTWIAQGPTRTLLIQQWFGPREVALVNGLSLVGLGVAEVLAIWATPPLMSGVGGWREAMIAYGAVSAGTLAVWALFARDHPGDFVRQAVASQSSASALRSAIRRPDVWWLLVIAMGSSISWSAFFTFWPSFAVDVQGLKLDVAGFIWGLGSVTLAIAAFLASPLSERWGRRKPLIWLPNLVAMPLFLALLSTSNPYLLGLYSAALGLCWVSLPIILTVPFELSRIQAREVPMVIALVAVAQNLGTTLGPLFVGATGEFTDDLALPLALASGFQLLTVLGASFLPETGRRSLVVVSAAGRPEGTA